MANLDGLAQPSLREYWPRRYTTVGLCFCATFICYIDRVNISVAIIPMAEQFGWDQTIRGFVLSSFFIGYMATQVLGGWLSDRFGGKVVLGAGVLLWSVFTLITPPAAMLGLTMLILARIGMGLGEGVAFPSIYTLFARWVPAAERTRAIGLNFSGVPLGTVAALMLTPVIVTWLGWEWAFYLFGILGFVWYVFWHTRVSRSPETHPTISRQELDYIQADLGAPPEAVRIPWRLLLSKAPIWAIIINHFCVNWGNYVILSWLPTYVVMALGVDMAVVGLYTVIPFLASFVCINLGGWLADRLLQTSLSVTAVRKIMQTIGCAGPALFLVLISTVSSAEGAIALMACVMGLAAFAMGGFGVNHLDVAPRYAGVLMGISNTAGTLPGIVGVVATGFILDITGSWAIVFGTAAAVYLIGLAVWLVFATGKRIID
jgi:MFS transporter, ACS family, solute carrier family 17 (sodium-dependent inorganic phosphate cotransporter), other